MQTSPFFSTGNDHNHRYHLLKSWLIRAMLKIFFPLVHNLTQYFKQNKKKHCASLLALFMQSRTLYNFELNL